MSWETQSERSGPEMKEKTIKLGCQGNDFDESGTA